MFRPITRFPNFEFFCMRCGHHPKILIHDLTKKAVFKYAVNEVQVPDDPEPEVDADAFWQNVNREIVARGFLRGKPNPFVMKPSYQNWAPYIGPNTRKSRFLYNTEFAKVKCTESEDHEPVPEEILTHLLTDEKLDTVRRFCRLIGVRAEGSKLDMLCQLRSNSLSKAKFNHAYSSLFGISGSWLSPTCQHNVTYAVKFLLRSESPRDYVDILRSMKHMPTVNIADIANTIAKMGNRTQTNFFHPNDGRIAVDTDDNIKAARDGKLEVSMEFLIDERPKTSSDPAVHPVTGTDAKYMLFDWFHQENCHIPKEYLRRSTLVKELAGYVNTQAAEQLHRDKARDVYWLNEMTPTNHVFAFRLVTHVKNYTINADTIKKQSKTISSLKRNDLGQLVKGDAPDYLHVIPSQQHYDQAIITSPSISGPIQTSDSPEVHPTTNEHDTLPRNDTNTSTQTTDNIITVCGTNYKIQTVAGDGNCLFRSLGVVIPGWTEQQHLELRNKAFEWCSENRNSMDISDDELKELATPDTPVGQCTPTALANVLQVGLMVAYKTKTGQEQQIFEPKGINTVDLFVVLFDFSGHYDAAIPLDGKTTKRTNRSERAFNAAKKRKQPEPIDRMKVKKRKTGQTPFTDLPRQTRQIMIMKWIGISDNTDGILDGHKIEEEDLEIRPDCISSCILDTNVKLNEIQPLMSRDAWVCLNQTVQKNTEKRPGHAMSATSTLLKEKSGFRVTTVCCGCTCCVPA